MDITSLLITFVGIIIILAIYIISRTSRTKLPQAKTTRLPDLKNEDGTRFTSVLDDIPARDGVTPTIKKSFSPAVEGVAESTTDDSTQDSDTKKKKSNSTEQHQQQQHILFISPNHEAGLNGNLVAKVLKKNGLTLGDMDIYHYLAKNTSKENKTNKKTSLFRVANGVAPWTLKKEDLHNKELAGLSIVLLTPSDIDDVEAVKRFISVSHTLSQEMNGVLKNHQQQIFTPKDEAELIASL
ncbi:MAG: cell division protein ZipA C-terminal FtsZ-binding domain-containing protein [Cocleimonas sp.]